jgi:ribosomal protein L31E
MRAFIYRAFEVGGVVVDEEMSDKLVKNKFQKVEKKFLTKTQKCVKLNLLRNRATDKNEK